MSIDLCRFRGQSPSVVEVVLYETNTANFMGVGSYLWRGTATEGSDS